MSTVLSRYHHRAVRAVARLHVGCGACAGGGSAAEYVVLQLLTERKEWKFFAVLPKAAPGLGAAWWAALLLRGILPAAFVIAMEAHRIEAYVSSLLDKSRPAISILKGPD